MICFSGFTRTRAHPRVGGENNRGSTGDLLLSGSSPRRRGKLVQVAMFIVFLRLIPA